MSGVPTEENTPDAPSKPKPALLRAEDRFFWDYWFLDDGILKVRILSRFQVFGISLLFFPALLADALFVDAIPANLDLTPVGGVLFVIVLFTLPFAPSAAVLVWYPHVKRKAARGLSQPELLKPPNQLIPWWDVVSIETKRRLATIQLRSGTTLVVRLRSDGQIVKGFVLDKMANPPAPPNTPGSQTLHFQPSTLSSSPPSDEAPLQPYICGMIGDYSLYVLSEDGLTHVAGIGRQGLWAVFIATIGVSFIFGVVLHVSSWLTLGMLSILLTMPIYEEVALRRVRRLLQIPPAELLSSSTLSDRVAWEYLSKASYTGNLLRIKAPTKVPPVAYLALEKDSAEKTLELLRTKLGDRLTANRRGPLARWFARLPSVPTIIFVLGALLLVAASVYPFFPGEQSHYAGILASTRSQFAGASAAKSFLLVFLNNVQIALADALPGFGQFTFAVSTYNTGRVIHEISIQDNTSAYALLQTLYSFPHTWIETLSYALADGLLIQSALRAFYLGSSASFSEQLRSWRSRPYIRLGIDFAKITALLVAAAFLEVVEPQLGATVYLLWIPVLGFALWYLRKYIERI